ncbi:MAG: transposase [Oscillospiraceae bacterium]|nr:transposase [Oscillospiraceae bacterium]
MLYNYFTEKLLNLQGVLIKNIEKINWQTGILNTFEYPYSNGFTEGCNNQIKVLKRTGYGYRNSNQFRKRILHIFSYRSRNNNEKEVA